MGTLGSRAPSPEQHSALRGALLGWGEAGRAAEVRREIWTRLCREVVESLSLGVFKKCVNVALGAAVQWWAWGNGWTG